MVSTLRALIGDEVEFENGVEPEFIVLEGNVLCSGDDKADREAEAEVRRRLEAGDTSAWCILVVTARWEGWEGMASLGAYQFPAGQKGWENQEYAKDDYSQLRVDALADLNQRIHKQYLKLSELRVLEVDQET